MTRRSGKRKFGRLMAKSEKRRKPGSDAPRSHSGRRPVALQRDGPGFALELTHRNWYLLAAATVLTLGGFVALSTGTPGSSTLLAPALLVAGYAVLAPLALIL